MASSKYLERNNMTSKEMAVIEQQEEVFQLPSLTDVRQQFTQIAAFQTLVRQSLVSGKDFGVIPGTGDKPTLLKPGAEKLVKLMGLADTYPDIEKIQDWDKGLFQYIVHCRLISMNSGVIVAEGVGECNSYEPKYRYRWVGDRELKELGLPPEGLRKRDRNSRSGGSYSQYRLENEDPAGQLNTLLKMAKKRALVDASLSAGRLSELFTQDLEDMPQEAAARSEAQPTPQRQSPAAKAKTPTYSRASTDFMNACVENSWTAGQVTGWLDIEPDEWTAKRIDGWLERNDGATYQDAIDLCNAKAQETSEPPGEEVERQATLS